MKKESDSTFALTRRDSGEPIVDQAAMARACGVLEEGEIKEYGLISPGSNYVFLATLVKDSDRFKAIYKPRQGEMPLWDFPRDTLYKREYASFILSEALGWRLIPPTVIRDGPYGIGSMQWFVESKNGGGHYQQLKDPEVLKQVALFDILLNNADRKAGHLLESRDGRLWLVDHGLTFNQAPKLRTVLWDFAGENIPERLLRDVRLLLDRLKPGAQLRGELGPLLQESELGALMGRVHEVLEKPIFPHPTSRWSIPFPWY
jgi:hypothetical protein